MRSPVEETVEAFGGPWRFQWTGSETAGDGFGAQSEIRPLTRAMLEEHRKSKDPCVIPFTEGIYVERVRQVQVGSTGQLVPGPWRFWATGPLLILIGDVLQNEEALQVEAFFDAQSRNWGERVTPEEWPELDLWADG